MEAKKNPAVAAAQAKKKAVNNIQKALTKKILTRLDDSQPLVNVFSKMQSLSKMMPAIQDFEQRLGILHQVEPILENAINTLSKVVDLGQPVSALALPKPPPPPPPKRKAAAAPNANLGQLKALLAQAEAAQAPAPEPEPEAAEEPAATLGGGDAGGLAALLAGLGGGEAEAAETPALETPSFLAAPAAEAPAAAPAEDGLGGSDQGALLSQLLGGLLLQTDSQMNFATPSESQLSK